MKRILAALALWACASAVLAGPLEEGRATYESGDYATALRLWRPLADQGDARAQYNLGDMYCNGHGVPKDYAEAVKWWRKSADQGFAVAQFNLGAMYANGKGVPQDYGEAVKWYRKAADQGLDGAQHDLGLMYATGQGVPQDYVEAHKWLNLAAARAPDKVTRDTATHNRGVIASKMTADQVSEAQKLAREWKPAPPMK